MPRTVYYQSSGNPLQLDRLPPEPLELEVAYHQTQDNDDHEFAQQVFRDAVALSAAAACFSGVVLTWPQLYGVSLVVMLVLMFVLTRFALLTLEATTAMAFPLLAITALVPLKVVPTSVASLVALALVVFLGREVARHYSFLATVSPMPLDEAWKTRMSTAWSTLWSSLSFLPVSIGLVFPAFLPLGCAVTVVACLLTTLWHVRNLKGSTHNFISGALSWCFYNRHDARIPGVLQSPAGGLPKRLVVLHGALLMVVVSGSTYCFAILSELTTGQHGANLAGVMAILLTSLVFVPLITLLSCAATVVAVFTVGVGAYSSLPLPRPGRVSAEQWRQITRILRNSLNPIEKRSIYIGRVAFDQSPLIVPRNLFSHHAHFLGDSGSGKTSRGLAPFLEHLIGLGDASFVVLDLKGDSKELLEAGRKGSEAAAEQGCEVAIKAWSLNPAEASHGFNPLDLDCWRQLDVLAKTDALCGALGLNYGSDYGEGYYSSANAAVLYATLRQFPNVSSFIELAEKLNYVIARPKAHGLDEKARDAGNHVKMCVTRLAAIPSLNITAGYSPSQSVLDHRIDPAALFKTPQLHYFNLPSALSPGSAPDVGCLAAFQTLGAASVTKREVPVYLIIDEFQRMASSNLDYLLQLARSMSVSVILANQSVEDLRRYNLVPVVETNCRYRQWFSISGWDDQQRLCQNSGETVDQLHSRSISTSTNDKGQSQSVSDSSQQFIAPRLTLNDIKLASDDDRKSVVLINRGDGYAQYGGMPVIVESDFHITADEYKSRRDAPWPSDLEGSFVPRDWSGASDASVKSQAPSVTPAITHEEFSDDKPQPQAKPPKKRRRQQKRKKQGAQAKQPTLTSGGPFDSYVREHFADPPASPEDTRTGEADAS